MNRALQQLRRRRLSARFQVWILAIVLTGLGFGLACFKHYQFGYPLKSGISEPVWTIEAEITFEASGQPVRASFALPDDSSHFLMIDESFSSYGYGFLREEDPGVGMRAVWSKREASGAQRLFYRGQFIPLKTPVEPRGSRKNSNHSLMPFWESSQQPIVNDWLEEARRLSSNPVDMAELLANKISSKEEQSLGILLSTYPDKQLASLLYDLLKTEGIQARIVRGLELEDGRRFQPVRQGVEVFFDGEWQMVSGALDAGNRSNPFFPWQRGGQSILDLEGGSNSQVSFSVLKDTRSAVVLAKQRERQTGNALLDFSIYSLPIEEQNVFKLLLLVPFGALVIVVLRNIIGLPTSGTFMPILIALAFQETDLVPGLILFVLIVGAGLGIRSLLSHLNLLVVPRISAVVIVVIILMAGLSIVSHQMNLPDGLKVTFFPMIIIAWTIERLSILWEEEGGESAAIQLGGSLIAAILAYLVMNLEWLRHITYTFPETLLVVLAITLILGQYTGYRLSELKRFNPLVKSGS